nr:MAG TPA: 50S ribosomal protein L1 [Caudoviricetes sp.]
MCDHVSNRGSHNLYKPGRFNYPMSSKSFIHCPVDGLIPDTVCPNCKYFEGHRTWACLYRVRHQIKQEDSRAKQLVEDMRNRIEEVNKKRRHKGV